MIHIVEYPSAEKDRAKEEAERRDMERRRKEWKAQHVGCPQCGNEGEKEVTTIGWGMGVEDPNWTWCHKCGWHGRVAQLKPPKTRP